MAGDVLKDIIAVKKERIAQARSAVSLDELKQKLHTAPAARPFARALQKPNQISLIAEIKRASPSRGVFRPDFDHCRIAAVYKELGVQAVSVLTEEDHFQGRLTHLRDVRELTALPLLRKDFIIEPYQLYESRAWGADAVLLIAECLSRDTLSELLALAGELGLECLVEVHSEKELRKILKLKVPTIGINNRNLRDLSVDFKTTEQLYPLVPREKTVVVESGISRRQDVLFLKILGVNAVLIGSAFMEAPDIRQRVEEIMGW